MPWHISIEGGKYCVIKDADGTSEGCSDTRAQAEAHLKALYANEPAQEEPQAAAEPLDYPATMETAIEPEVSIEATNGLAYEAADGEIPWEGDIVFEGQMTGDNRIFNDGSITFGDFPMPFRWAREDHGGHDGAVVIGRVDGVRNSDGGAKRAFGVILPSVPESGEYLSLLKAGAAGGVSIDGDSAQYDVIQSDGPNTVTTSDGTVVQLPEDKMVFTALRVRALTAVSIPAFMTGKIALLAVEPILASAIPVFPPAEWFADPDLEGPTPINITEDGRIFGHLATFGTCHIGFPNDCVKPPKGNTYDYFHTGELIAAEGDAIPVGHLTFDTGHADLHSSAMAAASHYDNTGTVAADVRAGEDEFGVWVSGALRSTLSDEQIRSFRSAPLSGDWRRIQGRMELVAALAVNTPGFPVPRARVLVADGSNSNETTILFTDPSQMQMTIAASVDPNPELTARKHQIAREVFGDLEEYVLVASAAGLPLADQNRAWDGPGAASRMLSAASDADGNINKGQASRGFFQVDGDGSKKGDYHLPFADIISGKLTAVPRGIFAVAAALQGSRGASITGADAIKPKVAAYYHRMNLKAPWESE